MTDGMRAFVEDASGPGFATAVAWRPSPAPDLARVWAAAQRVLPRPLAQRHGLVLGHGRRRADEVRLVAGDEDDARTLAE